MKMNLRRRQLYTVNLLESRCQYLLLSRSASDRKAELYTHWFTTHLSHSTGIWFFFSCLFSQTSHHIQAPLLLHEYVSWCPSLKGRKGRIDRARPAAAGPAFLVFRPCLLLVLLLPNSFAVIEHRCWLTTTTTHRASNSVQETQWEGICSFFCPNHLSITKLPNNEITKLRNLFLIFFLVLGLIFLKKAKRSKYQDDYAIHFGTFEKCLAQNQKKYQE